MGVWGTGNLENDTAQDMLAGICDDYFARIVATLQSSQGHEYDEYEHDELFVLIEMLVALHERGMVNSAPEPDTLTPLFSPFLERWADFHREQGWDPPEGRRKVMEESFTALTGIASAADEK